MQNTGHFVTLMDGTLISVTDPDYRMLKLEHVAHAAANLCRYGGQSPRFYSVAEHCCLMTELALAHPEHRRYAKEVLLHDANECFGLGDLPRPVKQHCPGYQAMQSKIDMAVTMAFKLDCSLEAQQVVKFYDELLLHAERHYFWQVSTDQNADPLWKNVDIECLTPDAAKFAFMGLLRHLNLVD